MKNNKICILYVEDEQGIRENLIIILKYLSDKLYTAKNGQEGLELYKEHKPDIVISDIKMPKMNGIEMVNAIKEISPKQAIIFTTAHSEASFFMDVINAHVDAYILKPVDLDILEDRIQHIIEHINLKRAYQKQKELMEEISNFQKNMLLVYDANNNIIFSNQTFLNFFNAIDTNEFLTQHPCLCNLFIAKEHFFTPNIKNNLHWITEIRNLDSDDRFVSLMNLTTSEENAFLVSINEIKKTAHTIVTFSEITRIMEQKNKFLEQSYTDLLTGLPNRRHFDEYAIDKLAQAKRNQDKLALLYIDLDGFKAVNDEISHQVGDMVLKTIGQRCHDFARANELIARIGGDEFAMIIYGYKERNDLGILATRLIKQGTKPVAYGGIEVNFGMSIGIATFPDNGDTLDRLLFQADSALYQVKNSQKGTFAFA